MPDGNDRDSTRLSFVLNGKEETLYFRHPEGTFRMTPAGRVSLEAIAGHSSLLKGNGIDWGCGVGCLSVAAAKLDALRKIYGLDISGENTILSINNSGTNRVSEKGAFF